MGGRVDGLETGGWKIRWTWNQIGGRRGGSGKR